MNRGVSAGGEPVGGGAAALDATASQRNRAAGRMAALTAVSRATGFARVIVVAAVLGTSYLGNTYQSANSIPNILFELFAAGVLQSVLVPVMVDAVDGGGREEGESVAGTVLGAMLALLAGLVAAGLVAGPWIMRALVSGVDDAAVRAAQVRLGTFFLFFFLPQILFYAANLVATAALNATGRFALPVFAPTVNNVVVIGTYLVFAVLRDGAPPSLDLTMAEQLVLAVGTTLGVVAFCAVPVVGLWRTGFRLVPRWAPRDPRLRRLARQGAWAAGFLGASQLLLVVVLYLSNAVEGGVVVYQLAYVLFMLPNSLFAVPVFTTAFPTLTRQARAGHWDDFASEVGRTTRSITLLTFTSAALLVALARPLAELVALGNAAGRSAEVAAAIAGFALALPGFSVLLFLTRVSYAIGNVRTPTLVNAVVAVVGAVVMFASVPTVADGRRVMVIGFGYAVAQTVGALLLAWAIRSRLHEEGARVRSVVLPVLRAVAAATAAGLAAWGVALAVDAGSPGPAVLAVAVGSVAGMLAVAVVVWVLRGPAPARLVRSLGGDVGPSGAVP
ncbi:MAG: murein biosynthesis integral membrane protein MurJ [Microthrixaceae bacterium]